MHRIEYQPGLTVVETPSQRSTIVPQLVCARLAEADGPVHWIDAGNAASTHVLYDCAPSPRWLEPVRIARAFTAYQHHSLVEQVTERADDRSSLLVATNVDALYRDDDLAAYERESLLTATLSTLRALGDALDVPVLASTTTPDAEIVTAHADGRLACVRTANDGHRLVGDGVAASGYWYRDYWQTTIPYWVDVCGVADAIDPVVAAADRGLLEPTLDAGWELAPGPDGGSTDEGVVDEGVVGVN